MKYTLGSIVLLLIFSSCGNVKEYKDVGENYDYEYDFKSDANIYRSTDTGKKINGKIILRNRGYIDTNLIFKDHALFDKGIQIGKDSVFRNDTLIEILNFSKGRKNGKQVTFRDSLKITSQYQDGYIHGEELKSINDVIVYRSNYSYGVKNGFEYEYDLNGEVKKTVEYQLDTNIWQIPYQQLKKVRVMDYSNSMISIYDYITNNRAKFMGVIKVFPSENTWMWPEEIIHSSEVNNRCSECTLTGRYYIIELWGGDDLDQIWTNEWFAYTTRFDSKYEFVQLKSHP